MEHWTSIVVAVIGLLGSASIWRYVEKRYITSSIEKKYELENSDTVQFRKDLQARVLKLEQKLEESEKEKSELRQKLLYLSIDFKEIKTKLDYVSRENEEMKRHMEKIEGENKVLKEMIK